MDKPASWVQLHIRLIAGSMGPCVSQAGVTIMAARFSFSIRRRYLRLSEERFSEILRSSERGWKPCVCALSVCRYLAPLCVLLAGVAIGAVVEPLPKLSAAMYAGALMLLAWLTPKGVVKLTHPFAQCCIQAACLGYFCALANNSKRTR